MAKLEFYDAHNHVQDDRLKPHWSAIWAGVQSESIAAMVVNGSCEKDWPDVLHAAQRHPAVMPAFGYHPWYVKERTPGWKESLVYYLDQVPSSIGEIGLDRWIKDYDLPAQEDAFVWQLRLAAERELPVSIHCLQAWGRMLELLQSNPLPRQGFLLHSFGGSAEMILQLVKLGAYFSLPGYFSHERKERQRAAFQQVPRDRFLIETDAPDQLPPQELILYPLDDSQGKPINHPANLRQIYNFGARLMNVPLEELTEQVAENFQRLFGPVGLPRAAFQNRKMYTESPPVTS